MEGNPPILLCPYCAGPLAWVPLRWFNRGCYHCARCGDFPDLEDTVEGPQKRAQFLPEGRYVPEPSSDRARVLLVDNAGEHRDLDALMLESIASVVTATGAEEAIALARVASFDAIIIDLLTPAVNGSELCASLKGNALSAHTPIIAVVPPGDAIASALRHQVEAVLMKPCPIERLVSTLETVMLRRPDGALRFRRRSLQRPPEDIGRSPAILVVDADYPTALMVQRELGRAGYVTVVATDFPSARQLLDSEPPDLVVAALRLGDFNGLQLVATSDRRTPTIILGENPVDEADSRALDAEYLSKPIDSEALVSLVHRMMKTGRSRRSRRWVRKSITARVPARLSDRPAYLLNVSYGGLCLETDVPPDPPPSFVDVTIPTAQLKVHVEVAWRDRQNASWRCGGELPAVTPEWKTFVDAIS